MTSQDAAPGNTAKTFGERWNEMYQRLVKFKERNGHCLVPNRYPEDKKLGAWVSAQRRHYKILTSGKKESTPMTLERAQKLIDIGFDWSTTDPRHVSWEDRYEQLKAFKTKYGHVQVPMGWSENSSLSNWVSAQRQDYKLFQKGRTSRLSQDKIDLLNQLGFVWEAQRGGRRRRLEPLPEQDQAPLSPSSQGAEEGEDDDEETKADPPGTMMNDPPTTASAVPARRRALASHTPQNIPSLMDAASSHAAALAASQASLLRGTAGMGALTPLQNRQLMSQFGAATLPAATALPSVGFDALMGRSPLGTPGPDVFFRLQAQQEQQQTRAAIAASLAARDSLSGQSLRASSIPSLPFAAMGAAPTAAQASMLGSLAVGAGAPIGTHIPGMAMLPSQFLPTSRNLDIGHGRMPEQELQAYRLSSTLASNSSSSSSNRVRKRPTSGDQETSARRPSMAIDDLFDPNTAKEDDTAGKEPAAKKAKKDE